METNKLTNKVTASGLVTIDLEKYYPTAEILELDLKGFLFKEMIIKEQDFRSDLKALDWQKYAEKIVIITCTTDAIIPMWAYMLVSSYLEGLAADVFIGNRHSYIECYFREKLKALDYSIYKDKKVVIKGCSDKPVPEMAYALITFYIKPFAQSIMFGEPCSTVPIFKRPRILINE